MPAHVAYPGVPIAIPVRWRYGRVTVAFGVQVCVDVPSLLLGDYGNRHQRCPFPHYYGGITAIVISGARSLTSFNIAEDGVHQAIAVVPTALD